MLIVLVATVIDGPSLHHPSHSVTAPVSALLQQLSAIDLFLSFVAPLVQLFLAPAAHFVAPAFSSFLPPSSRHLPSCCISVSLTLLHRSFSALVLLCQCFLFLLHLSYPSPYCTTPSRSIVPALKFPLPFHQLEYHILARICENRDGQGISEDYFCGIQDHH